MKKWYLVLYGFLLGLLSTGVILLISQRERGIPVTLNPAPTATQTMRPKATPSRVPIQVQIGGEIVNPGIFLVDEESRLADLITKAGGLTSAADNDRINFAALLHDGDYFFIPSIDQLIPETARNAPLNIDLDENSKFVYPFDLNEASQEALESLPGIGPEKAADILAYKEQFGPFSSVDDLLNVPGIGQKTLETIRDFLIVEN